MSPNKIPFNVAMAGRYMLEAVNSKTGERRQLTDWFENLITDLGLNRAGAGNSVDAYCYVGTGSTAPTNADTQMQAQIASSNTTQAEVAGNLTSSPYYAWNRKTYRFAQGAAAGNLSEVGIGWASSSAAAIFSRSLIKDTNGNPTTVTVLADEYLDVTYELRIYPPLTDATFNVVISGVTYGVTCRPASVTNSSYWTVGRFLTNGVRLYQVSYVARAYTGSLGAITAFPSGLISPSGEESSYSNGAYSDNTFYRTGAVTWGLNSGNNAAGIKSVHIMTSIGTFQMEFDTALPKDANKILTLNTKVNFSRYSV